MFSFHRSNNNTLVVWFTHYSLLWSASPLIDCIITVFTMLPHRKLRRRTEKRCSKRPRTRRTYTTRTTMRVTRSSKWAGLLARRRTRHKRTPRCTRHTEWSVSLPTGRRNLEVGPWSWNWELWTVCTALRNRRRRSWSVPGCALCRPRSRSPNGKFRPNNAPKLRVFYHALHLNDGGEMLIINYIKVLMRFFT